MLTHAGKEAHEIYKTFHWDDEGDAMKFDKVFKEYSMPCRNILYECHKFWSLEQEEGETIHAYVTRLKIQVDHCDYQKEGWPSAIQTEMIRDKFVFGLNDDNLKERLLQEADISLEKLVTLAQRTESSRQQVKEMTSHVKAADAEFLCRQCGYKHRPRECPAYGQQCTACHKLHHFAIVCPSKQLINVNKNTKSSNPSNSRRKVHIVHKDDTSSDTYSEPQVFIQALHVHGITGSSCSPQCIQKVEKSHSNLIQVQKLVSCQ